MTAHELLGAPDDVRRTVAWFHAEGWREQVDADPDGVRRFRSLAGDVALITRDRGQWRLDVRLVGWDAPHDIDLVLVAALGETPARWAPAARWEAPLAEQLPVGVSWREALPIVLTRLRGDGGAERRLVALRDERSRALADGRHADIAALRPHRGGRRWSRIGSRRGTG